MTCFIRKDESSLITEINISNDVDLYEKWGRFNVLCVMFVIKISADIRGSVSVDQHNKVKELLNGVNE